MYIVGDACNAPCPDYLTCGTSSSVSAIFCDASLCSAHRDHAACAPLSYKSISRHIRNNIRVGPHTYCESTSTRLRKDPPSLLP